MISVARMLHVQRNALQQGMSELQLDDSLSARHIVQHLSSLCVSMSVCSMAVRACACVCNVHMQCTCV